ncbi:2,5-diamino-6-(ribosylamino)-4(3H)-pyrimidinone 5'-phosphate reductase [Orbilia blumenaviensis]|uniref:2,5-diamino-6-ribosylamino-4(3H)-pyrimidinone 5'-phosphate reductase n=1 Tax=Orbilia blumenaviensis TaxID=1796055 RepID=A0AAV9U4I1_9PEZI
MSQISALPEEYATPLAPYLPLLGPHELPHLTLTYATSLDSAISLSPGTQTHLSGPISKAMTHHLRSFHDAILVGVSTAVADDPGLNCRIEGAQSQPIPVILDPSGRWEITESARVIETAKVGNGRAPLIIIDSKYLDNDNVVQRNKMLQKYGGKYIGLDLDEKGRFDWRSILLALKSLGVESLMVEGGATVINTLLGTDETRQLIGSVIVTFAPTWLGQGGVIVSPKREFDDEGKYEPPRLKEVKWIPMDQDVVLCGRVTRK